MLMRTGPARAVHRPPPGTPTHPHGALRRPTPPARRPGQRTPRRHRRPRTAGARAQPDRAAARPRAVRRRDPANPGPGQPQRGARAHRPAGPVRATAGRRAPACPTKTASPPSAPTSASAPDKAHNLRRQLTLPEPIRSRVAERPGGDQLSVTMANRLADMHEIAPELTLAVAERITTADLHDEGAARPRRLRAPHRRRERAHLRHPHRRRRAARRRRPDRAGPRPPHTGRPAAGRPRARLHRSTSSTASSTRSTARAKTKALKIRVDGALRDRARTGRYAYVHERGRDFAAGIWVIDPVFMLDVVREHLEHADDHPARHETYFAGARLDDAELRAAAEQDRAAPRRAARPPRRRLHAPTSGSATTCAPGSSTPATRSCTRSKRSSATCSPATTAR